MEGKEKMVSSEERWNDIDDNVGINTVKKLQYDYHSHKADIYVYFRQWRPTSFPPCLTLTLNPLNP